MKKTVVALLFAAIVGGTNEKTDTVRLLNVSHDSTRELYQDVNRAFIAHWKKKTGVVVEIQQSHAASSAQARAILDGLEADVVSLASSYDVDVLAKRGLVASDWRQRFARRSTPYTSTIVFLVRRGNPKQISDWDDLVRGGVSVITPNPKTSGSGRWTYLAAYGYALNANRGDEAEAHAFVRRLYRNVPLFDAGARGATTTFAQREIGDVLLAPENEAHLVVEELGGEKFEIVVPPTSILAEPSVAVVERVTERRATTEVARAYVEFLYSPEGQAITDAHHYRSNVSRRPAVELFTVDERFGGWDAAQKRHFDDRGRFDDLVEEYGR